MKRIHAVSWLWRAPSKQPRWNQAGKRIDAIEKFFDFLHKAKPGENEKWLKMMRILDAEVEKLKAQPKADGAFGQAILDEAKNQIKGYAAELKQEFGGQFLVAASTAVLINSYVESKSGMAENRLAAADAALAIL